MNSKERLEMARGLALDAVLSVDLQKRRVYDETPDPFYAGRWWADVQFLIIALRRLRLAAEFGAKADSSIKRAVKDFRKNIPDLDRFRNVGEHMDHYAAGFGKDQTVDRRQVLEGSLDVPVYRWLDRELNIDHARDEAEKLWIAVSDAAKRAGA